MSLWLFNPCSPCCGGRTCVPNVNPNLTYFRFNRFAGTGFLNDSYSYFSNCNYNPGYGDVAPDFKFGTGFIKSIESNRTVYEVELTDHGPQTYYERNFTPTAFASISLCQPTGIWRYCPTFGSLCSDGSTPPFPAPPITVPPPGYIINGSGDLYNELTSRNTFSYSGRLTFSLYGNFAPDYTNYPYYLPGFACSDCYYYLRVSSSGFNISDGGSRNVLTTFIQQPTGMAERVIVDTLPCKLDNTFWESAVTDESSEGLFSGNVTSACAVLSNRCLPSGQSLSPDSIFNFGLQNVITTNNSGINSNITDNFSFNNRLLTFEPAIVVDPDVDIPCSLEEFDNNQPFRFLVDYSEYVNDIYGENVIYDEDFNVIDVISYLAHTSRIGIRIPRQTGLLNFNGYFWESPQNIWYQAYGNLCNNSLNPFTSNGYGNDDVITASGNLKLCVFQNTPPSNAPDCPNYQKLAYFFQNDDRHLIPVGIGSPSYPDTITFDNSFQPSISSIGSPFKFNPISSLRGSGVACEDCVCPPQVPSGYYFDSSYLPFLDGYYQAVNLVDFNWHGASYIAPASGYFYAPFTYAQDSGNYPTLQNSPNWSYYMLYPGRGSGILIPNFLRTCATSSGFIVVTQRETMPSIDYGCY